MIVKKISYTNFSKTKARRIGDLVDYIRQPHDRNPEEKVASAGAINFTATTHEGQRAEMISLAERSKKSRMPVSNWIFSWREGEQSTPQQVARLVVFSCGKWACKGTSASTPCITTRTTSTSTSLSTA